MNTHSQAQSEIRKILLNYPDGLDMKRISELYGKASKRSILTTLRKMGDVYIDRWEKTTRCGYKAIYIAVPIPDNAPMPEIVKKMVNGGKSKPRQKTDLFKMMRLPEVKFPSVGLQ